jgi:class 3 adenylate cyclase
MAKPHNGTITFLFTDVEGSTALWEKNPGAMSEALYRHDEILRTAIEAHNGQVLRPSGTPSTPSSRPLPMPFGRHSRLRGSLSARNGPKQDPFG